MIPSITMILPFRIRFSTNLAQWYGRMSTRLLKFSMLICRYVVLNPVRAHLVEHPDAWQWKSYRATSGKENPHPCLTIDWVLGQFSAKQDKARKEYQQFAKWEIGEASTW
jgi:hypothetical protein